MAAGPESLTPLLEAAAAGADGALERLFERIYPELRRLASRIRQDRAGETLSTTALAHEAYLKLAAAERVSWQGRAHFFAVAARAMRQIVVDRARRRMARKRGGSARAVTLDESAGAAPARPEELVALDEALTRLAAFDPRRAAVVEHRFFGGLTTAEIAAVLDVSPATVERDWRAARSWLATEMGATDA